jgi:hypothetical protein
MDKEGPLYKLRNWTEQIVLRRYVTAEHDNNLVHVLLCSGISGSKLMFIILKVKEDVSQVVPQTKVTILRNRRGGDVGVPSEKPGHIVLMRINSFVLPLIATIMELRNVTCA